MVSDLRLTPPTVCGVIVTFRSSRSPASLGSPATERVAGVFAGAICTGAAGIVLGACETEEKSVDSVTWRESEVVVGSG